MRGSDIKKFILASGHNITEVAAAIGKSQQNLSAALAAEDVKTGLVESIAQFLGVPISYLYGEGNTAAADHGSTAVAGNGNNLADHALIEEIAAQRRLTEQAMSQNDRLIGIINNLTKE